VSRTNLLLFLTDDQGPWAAGCCGNSEIRTPNIDRLAETGTRFEHFFCATPVCSPSRATLLTGRIPSQHGIHDWLRGCSLGPGARRFLDGEIGYSRIMAEHGYRCGLSGKWHMGDDALAQQGFTDWFMACNGPYYGADCVRDGLQYKEEGYVTDVITEEALSTLDRYAAADGPFYLSVHYTAPHSPWIGQHPPELVESYADCEFTSCPQESLHPGAGPLTQAHHGKREALQSYFAAVTAMDAGVGRIIDRLEATGLRENTLIVFLSDNGMSCGQHGFWGKGNGTDPRNMYENSIKVPAIFSQPGRIPQGKVHSAMVSAYDFMPTLLEYLELPRPADRNLPGVSFLPALEGRPLEGREEVVIFDEYGPVRMIRTERWKYVHRHPHGPHELFDLEDDPGERRNLIADAGHEQRIAELRARLEEWFARYVNPEINGLKMNGSAHGQTDHMDWHRD
jgi:arylsulfatase A-like enzyme